MSVSRIPRPSSTSSTGSLPPPYPLQLGQDLLDAAEDGDSTKVGELLKEGADVNYASAEDGMTALLHAAAFGHRDLSIELCDRGADETATNNEQANAIHLAAAGGHGMIIRDLVWKGVKINAQQWDHSTPLHLAVQNGHQETVMELLKRGADANLEDKGWKRTPLHVATKDGRYDLAELLLKHKAMPNVQDSTGTSPLHEAVQANNCNIAELLLERGADIHLKENVGNNSPLDDAKTDEMKELLQKYADRPPVYEEVVPDLSEVNPFEANLDKLKSSSSDDLKGRAATLPADLGKSKTPDNPKPAKKSLLSKFKSRSKENLTDGNGSNKGKKLVSSYESPTQSPLLSRIPLDGKMKLAQKLDLNKYASDPTSIHQIMARRGSADQLDSADDGKKSFIPKPSPKDGSSPSTVERRMKNPWGGKLDLNEKKNRYSTLPKDMKYSDAREEVDLVSDDSSTDGGSPLKLLQGKPPPSPLVSNGNDNHVDSQETNVPNPEHIVSDINKDSSTIEDIICSDSSNEQSQVAPTDIPNETDSEKSYQLKKLSSTDVEKDSSKHSDNRAKNENHSGTTEHVLSTNNNPSPKDDSSNIWQIDADASKRNSLSGVNLSVDAHKPEKKKGKKMWCCCFGV